MLEIGQGDWEGLHRDEVETRYAAELGLWRRRPHEGWAPGGESLSDVQERAAASLKATIERLGAGREPGTGGRGMVAGYQDPALDQPWTVLVGHDGVFKVVLLTLFGLPLDRFWMWSMDLCAITVVELRGGHAVLRAHNLTAHLDPAPSPAGAQEPDPTSESPTPEPDRGGAL
jgi:broad specificity phosphatase PhoE